MALDVTIVLLCVTAVTVSLAGVVRWLAPRIGAIVPGGGRRIHERPTATLGGAAMYGGILVGLVVAARLESFRPAFEASSEPLGVVIAAGVMFLVGAADDLYELSAPAKLAGQILAASLLYLLGVTLFFVRVPLGGLLALSPDWSALVTVAWVVLVANAINLIDGLDGLAAGVVAVAALSSFVYGLRLNDAGLIGDDNIGPLLALITLGACLGFLPHNFYPARIFMGDGGALLLGLMMATSTLTVGGRVVDQFSGQTFFFFAPVVIPIVTLGVPLLDTMFSVIRRLARRDGIATADKDHLHHRLMRMGHGHRRSVLILWAWTALLSGAVLYPTFTGDGDAMVPIFVAAMGLALATWFRVGADETPAEA